MGADTNLLDDTDGDLLDNLREYAFGGNPSNIGDQGSVPVHLQMSVGGTNYIEYIYDERDDAIDRGLSSGIEVGTDLVMTNWADGSAHETGRGASGISGYNALANRIPVGSEANKFIRLKVGFTP